MATTRKTAAQKAAEAAEREEFTGTHEASSDQDKDLTEYEDDKGKKLTVQQLKNKLRNEAEREVLDTHKPEVIAITEAKYKDLNLTYVRRLTDEEKAAKAIEEYFVKFPKLRPQLLQQQQQLVDDTVPPVVTYAEAIPGGALEAFRAEPDITEYADVEPEPGAHYEEDESGDLSYPSEHGQPDGSQ